MAVSEVRYLPPPETSLQDDIEVHVPTGRTFRIRGQWLSIPQTLDHLWHVDRTGQSESDASA